MWLKLEFPLTGEAKKQENRGRGRKGEREREGEDEQVSHTSKMFVSSSLVFPSGFCRLKATHSAVTR